MQINHLQLLCDPLTREPLSLIDEVIVDGEIISGTLVGSKRYPITNGIPRFVSDEGYSRNFGYQWNKWARVQFEDQNIGRPMEGYTKNMFDEITDGEFQDLSSKLVLDMGCGPGRFSDLVLSRGGSVIALDYSSAIDAARLNFKDYKTRTLLIQGDALMLPIRTDSVDAVFSIGVLHHTPEPKSGVTEAYRVLRNGGSFALAVYGRRGYYAFPVVNAWRTLFNYLRPISGNTPALIYSHIVARIAFVLGSVWPPLSLPFRAVFSSVYLPDLRWAILDTFDSITPSYQSSHEFRQVYEWFNDAKFKEIKPGRWHPTNCIGFKR